MEIVQIILLLAVIYLLCGFLFAIIFSFRLVNKFDEEARAAPFMFRLLIIPATTLLWPVVLKKVRQKKNS